MAALTTPTVIERGTHQITIIIGTGTATLKIKSQDVPTAQPLPNGNFSASTVTLMDIGSGELSADITGDAQVFVDLVSSGES
jgi:hypothetical protein